ncbi:MAG: DUF3810 family protein, partial [Ginsengibacter sp.]
MASFDNSGRKRSIWLGAFLLIIGIKIIAHNNYDVEKFYTKGFYYFFAIALRSLFGWIPFSFGDIVYFVAGCWLLRKVIKNSSLLFKRKFTRQLFMRKMWKAIFLFTSIYIVFNIFWGLN